MPFIYNPTSVMFYQDDLVISYKDFLLIAKYFDEQVFRGINPKKVAIVLPDSLTGACLLLYCLQKYAVLPLTTKSLATEYESVLENFAADIVITYESDKADAIHLACTNSNTPLLTIPELLAYELEHIRNTYSNLPLSADIFNLNQGKLILFTSGTTGKPKQVCLSWVNILASIKNISTSYNLRAADICLNVMPLYHIHGIIACLLSTIYSGGSVILLKDGFDVINFFNQLFDLSPSWYSAVPTIHQSICNRILAKYKGKIEHKLRFIRSSSSALPNKVYNDLVALFNTPVYQAYGMTEACHQISTQLATHPSAVGSVGFGQNVLIKIRDEMNSDQIANVQGTVWIKGTNLFEHYENLSKEASGFSEDGYFNTGDIGYLDVDGALTIVSRIKEMINKGGEKIAPKEIEDIILTHPLVANAVCFSIDDTYYGENIGLAIVTMADGKLNSETIKKYLGNFLNEFKQPREIYFVDELPKGKTGKLQRIGLSQTLKDMGILPQDNTLTYNGLDINQDVDLVNSITQIWETVLQISPIKDNDNYFLLGGDSILAIKLVNELNKQITKFNRKLSIADIFTYNSIRQLANYINQESHKYNYLIKQMNNSTSSKLLFFIHPGMGGCEIYFGLANLLTQSYQCYGIDNYNINNNKQITNLYDLANLYLSYIEEVRQQNNIGPNATYNLAGWSLGGRIALKIASILEKKGISNINIICIDAIINDGDQKIANMRKNVVSNHMKELHLWVEGLYQDENYVKNVKRAMNSEELISLESIASKLASTRILLFKAAKLDKDSLKFEDKLEFNNYVLELPNNNLDSIVREKGQFKTISLDCHHFNIMEQFNQISDKTIALGEAHFFHD